LVKVNVPAFVVAPGNAVAFEGGGSRVAVEAEAASDLANGLTVLIGGDHGGTLGFCRSLACAGGSSGCFLSFAFGQLQEATDPFALVSDVRVQR
jgi:hypothetical protein